MNHYLTTLTTKPLSNIQMTDRVWGERKDRFRITYQKSYFDPSNQKFVHKYDCYLEPIFAYSPSHKTVDIITWKPEKIEKYHLKRFSIYTDKSCRYLKDVYIGRQFHPHKNPKTRCLCVGEYFQNKEISDKLVDFLVFACMMKFNKDDCYILPNMNDAKEIVKCQIF